MKTITRAALTAALMLGVAASGLTVAAPAWAKKEEKPAGPPAIKLSKPVQAALQDAQKKQAAGDFPGARAAIDLADAAKTTNDDAFVISQMKVNLGIATKDNALLEQALDAGLATGMVSATDTPKYLRNSAALAIQRNDYAKATAAYEKLSALNPNDGETLINLAELYQRTKQTAKSVDAFNRAIAASKATSTPVPENWYRRELAIAYDAKLPNETRTSSLALVTAFPNPTNWRDALTIFRESAKLDDQASLDTLRLARATSALAGERDYFEYADTASQRGLSGEAKSVLDEGIAKGALSTSKPFVAELVKVVGPKAASGKASLAGLEKESAASKTGKLALGTADGYLSYGNYAKAAPLYKMALDKGGVDAAVANTRLGIALAMTGDKAGATAAFQAVKGGPRETVAQFWLAYLATKA